MANSSAYVIVEHAPKPYRVRKYDDEGEMVEEHWCFTRHAADQKVEEIQGVLNVVRSTFV